MMTILTRPLGVAGLLLVSHLSPAEPFQVSGEQQHTEVVRGSAAAYTIHIGGTADMDNTATRHHETWSIAFQNNIALILENTGDVPVENPRIITNDRRKWHTVESMIAEFTAGAKNDQERIYLIWEGLRQHRHHDYPLFGDDYHDPVRFLNIYGGGFCDDSSASGAALYHTAGFSQAAGGQDPFQRGLHGHVMCEVWHDGDYQFMDIDQDTFFLDRENRKPVSGDTATRDHDYARRELAYGPLFPGWDAAIPNAALFGEDDVRTTYWSTGHEIGYTLRPGERLTYYWERANKTPWQLQAHEHRYYSNSQLVYAPPTTPARLAGTGVLLEGFEATPDGFTITGEAATMTIPVSTAYTICGATLQARVSRNFPPSAAFVVELSLDGGNYTEIYRRMALPRWDMRVVLDEALGVAGGAPKRDYWVRIRCEKAAGASVSGLVMTTDLYAYPIALPRLSVGENAVTYSDDTAGDHELTVTYRWRESGNVTPPAPPQAPQAPTPDSNVSETYVLFAWPAVEGCDAYALRVSRDPEMKYPYRPNYDVILPENTYRVPFRGMFNPGETYYWRIWPRLANGLWGDWSPIWTFTWSGPMVPRDVTLEVQGETSATLRWAPNPSGAAPTRYRVYGSNEKGFSIGDASIQAMHQGPPLAFAETSENEMLVGGRDATGPLANHAYYRVVAIDAAGVESCPSDYAEIPRPYVHSVPVTTARTGQPYRYPIATITSYGDWQHRYDSPGDAYWEKEGYRFERIEGPAWLSVEPDTGLVSGTPPEGAAGSHPVTIGITVHFPHEVSTDGVQAAAFRTPMERRISSGEHRFVVQVAS